MFKRALRPFGEGAFRGPERREMERKLYCNGTMLTMGREMYAQAVLTEGERILAVGEPGELKAMGGGQARVMDLQGRTLLPGFVDAHSHFTACASRLMEADLTGADSFEEIGRRLREFTKLRQVPEGQWVRGAGYDQNLLREGRHPDRFLLDEALGDRPAVISHQSGHMGVFNTAALKRLGVRAEAQAPSGGMMGRYEDGSLTGYMEEAAFLKYQSMVPMASPQDFLEAYRQAQSLYFSCGITTAQEGLMDQAMEGLYRLLLRSGILKLDVTAYGDVKEGEGLFEAFREYTGRYRDHFRLGGWKMFLDGSPQGRTAWLREPYAPAADGGEGPGYKGYPVLEDGQVYEYLRRAQEGGRQILTHCNGDGACAQYLKEYKRVLADLGLPNAGDARPVMIHAQLLGLDQLLEVKRLGVMPSFFAAHVYHWGDVHVRNLGFERASRISPAASALKAGIAFTFHQDSPVIRPDMLETIWCAVNRRTRGGTVLGPQERIPALEALRAVTVNGAWQYFEEKEKGALKPGMKADFVILDKDPLRTRPEELREIQVEATVKAGEIVYGGV